MKPDPRLRARRLSRKWAPVHAMVALALALSFVHAALTGTGGSTRGPEERSRRAPADLDERVDAMIANPPARLAGLDVEVQRLLARSLIRGTLVEPDGRAYSSPSIWEFMDEHMTGSQIQTLVEVHHAAKELDLWDSIESLRRVYAWSSWGIEFYGPIEPLRARRDRDGFCHDIDAIVRRDHGNSRHEWWRSLWNWEGVGNPHLGIDAGEGFHNLHLDSTSPAISRGWLGDGARCRYGIFRLITHNVEIRFFSEGDLSAVGSFIQLERMAYGHRHVMGWLNQDLAYADPGTTAAWVPVRDQLAASEGTREDLTNEAKRIATLEDGYLQIGTLLSGPGQSYAQGLLEGLRKFADALTDEGISNGYFATVMAPPPLGFWPTGARGNEVEEADWKTLSAFRDKVAVEARSYAIPENEIDRVMSVFVRVRQRTAQSRAGGS